MLRYFVCLLIICGTYSNASELDPTAEINAELAKLRDYKIESEVCKSVCLAPGLTDKFGNCLIIRQDGTPEESQSSRYGNLSFLDEFRNTGCCEWGQSCTQKMGKLKLKSTAEIVSTRVEYGDVIYQDFPDNAVASNFSWNNCTGADASVSETVTLSSRRQNTITTTSSVRNSHTIGISVGVKAEMFGFGTNVKTDYKFQRSHSLTDTKSESESETITRTRTIRTEVRPGKKLTFEAVIFDYKGNIPLTIYGEADGAVINNAERIRRASDVLAAASRVFTIEGEIEATAVSDMVVHSFEEDADCENNDGQAIEKLQYSGLNTVYSQIDWSHLDPQVNRLRLTLTEDTCENGRCEGPGSSCEATNDNGDKHCSISCPAGEEAYCEDGAEGTDPYCDCL